MTAVLGLTLADAKARLEQAGAAVECREISCRKGSPGTDLRVVAQREEDGKIILFYAGFCTTVAHTSSK